MPDQSPVFTNVTYVNAASGNVGAAIATATIPAVAGKTAYLTGFTITSSGSTGAAVVSPTVTGLLSGTLTYTYSSVAGVTLANPVLAEKFPIALPASAAGVAIAVVLPSLGAGNTNATVVAYGFYI